MKRVAEIPPFTEDGVLPAGDWEASFEELRASILVKGPGYGYPNWYASWRAELVDRLEILVRQLWEVGIEEVFIDGSFAEDKDHPNDIDGYFECDAERLVSGELQDELNQLDPHRTWSWDPAERRPYRGYPKQQLPMSHQYRIELYPHTPGLIAAHDHRGHALEFPSWFRLSRRPLASGAEEKGIVKLRRTA
jgi:hypothetical protein